MKISQIVLAMMIGAFIGFFFSDGGEQSSADASSASEVWTCSMHPDVHSVDPGLCPICAMDLIPQSSMKSTDVLSQAQRQQHHIETQQVTEAYPEIRLELRGYVETDADQLVEQSAHFDMRIESVLVKQIGQAVKKGDVLATFFSQELNRLQSDLLSAVQYSEQYPDRIVALKQKMKGYHLTDGQITQIIRRGTVLENFPLLAESDGIVRQNQLRIGKYVAEGTSLVQLETNEQKWLAAEIPEKYADSFQGELGMLHLEVNGDELELPIQLVDPSVDQRTRLIQIRTLLPKDVQLFDNQHVDVVWRRQFPEEQVIIPETAILWMGKEAMVYVETNGTFSARVVQIEGFVHDGIVVRSGLTPGETIATQGAFVLDAAAQLRGDASLMNITVKQLSEGDVEILKEWFERYLALKNSLVADDLVSAKEKAQQWLVSDGRIATEAILSVDVTVEAALQAIIDCSDISEARVAFESLSKQLIDIERGYNVVSKPLYLSFCPMALNNQGAQWLSEESSIANPYFGASMLKCGEVVQSMP